MTTLNLSESKAVQMVKMSSYVSHRVNGDKAKINTQTQPAAVPDNNKKMLSHIEIKRVTEKSNGTSTNTDNKVILISTSSGKTVKLLPKSSVILKKCDSVELKRLTNNLEIDKTYVWKKKNVAECSKTDERLRGGVTQPLSERPQCKLSFTPKFVKLKADEKMPKPVVKKYQRKEFVSASVQAVAAVQDVATQTEPDVPDIMPLVEYICDTPKYSASIDKNERESLMMLSQDVMTQAVAPKVTATEDRIKLFTDMRDCVICDQQGNLPLHTAVIENNLEAVKRQCMLLAFRTSNINCENKDGLTPLQLAVVHDCDASIVLVLVRYKSLLHLLDANRNNVLHLAVEYCGEDVLRTLLDNCDNLHRIIDGKNDDGVTALILAVTSDRLGMVRLLLEHNADPNVQDEKSGQTALFHAIQNGSTAIADLLIEHRADPKISTYTGINSVEAAKELNFPLRCVTEPRTNTTNAAAKRKQNTDARKSKRNKL